MEKLSSLLLEETSNNSFLAAVSAHHIKQLRNLRYNTSLEFATFFKLCLKVFKQIIWKTYWLDFSDIRAWINTIEDEHIDH